MPTSLEKISFVLHVDSRGACRLHIEKGALAATQLRFITVENIQESYAKTERDPATGHYITTVDLAKLPGFHAASSFIDFVYFLPMGLTNKLEDSIFLSPSAVSLYANDAWHIAEPLGYDPNYVPMLPDRSKAACWLPVWERHLDLETVRAQINQGCGQINLIGFEILPSGNFEPMYSKKEHRYNSLPSTVLGTLKSSYPELQVGLTLGGAASHEVFERISQDPEALNHFVDNVISAVKKLGFNEVIIDWESPDGILYPNFADIERVVLALANASQQAEAPFLLSMAVPGGKQDIRRYTSLEWKKLAEPLFKMYVMNYDYTGSWSEKAEHHASMEDSTSTLNYYLDLLGESARTKLVVGFPLYGKAFSVETLGDTNGRGQRRMPDSPVTIVPLRELTAASTPKPAIYAVDNKNKVAFADNEALIHQKIELASRFGGAHFFAMTHVNSGQVIEPAFTLLKTLMEVNIENQKIIDEGINALRSEVNRTFSDSFAIPDAGTVSSLTGTVSPTFFVQPSSKALAAPLNASSSENTYRRSALSGALVSPALVGVGLVLLLLLGVYLYKRMSNTENQNEKEPFPSTPPSSPPDSPTSKARRMEAGLPPSPIKTKF